MPGCILCTQVYVLYVQWYLNVPIIQNSVCDFSPIVPGYLDTSTMYTTGERVIVKPTAHSTLYTLYTFLFVLLSWRSTVQNTDLRVNNVRVDIVNSFNPIQPLPPSLLPSEYPFADMCPGFNSQDWVFLAHSLLFTGCKLQGSVVKLYISDDLNPTLQTLKTIGTQKVIL